MASVLRVRLSDRDIGVLPQVQSFTPRAGAVAARSLASLAGGVDDLARSGLRAAAAFKAAREREDERAAENAAAEWESAVFDGFNGRTVEDPNGTVHRVDGIAQRKWSDYGDDRSPLTDLAEIERDFQSSPTFRGLSSGARERFDRRVAARRMAYQAKANELYDRHRADRQKHFDGLADDNDANAMNQANFADAESFDSVMMERTKSMVDRRFRDMDLSDERVAPLYGTALVALRKTFATKHVEALAAAAETGTPVVVDGGPVDGEELLSRADDYLGSLRDRRLLSDQEGAALSARIAQSRERLDAHRRAEVTAAAAAALVRAHEPDGVRTLDAAISGLRHRALSLPKGSSAQTEALAQAKRLDEAADRRVSTDLLDRLLDPSSAVTPAAPGGEGAAPAEPVFLPGSREERLYPEVKRKYDAMVEKEQSRRRAEAARRDRETRRLRDEACASNFHLLRLEQYEHLAEGRCQQYLDLIAGMAVNGDITVKDYIKLRDEFNGKIEDGYDPDKLTPRQKVAKDVAEVVKEFPEDLILERGDEDYLSDVAQRLAEYQGVEVNWTIDRVKGIIPAKKPEPLDVKESIRNYCSFLMRNRDVRESAESVSRIMAYADDIRAEGGKYAKERDRRVFKNAPSRVSPWGASSGATEEGDGEEE